MPFPESLRTLWEFFLHREPFVGLVLDELVREDRLLLGNMNGLPNWLLCSTEQQAVAP